MDCACVLNVCVYRVPRVVLCDKCVCSATVPCLSVGTSVCVNVLNGVCPVCHGLCCVLCVFCERACVC